MKISQLIEYWDDEFVEAVFEYLLTKFAPSEERLADILFPQTDDGQWWYEAGGIAVWIV